jgi:MFS family permease
VKDPALCRAEEKGDDRTQEKIAAPGSPFRSLRDGNFRLYWCSMCLSSLAIWIQNAAQPWLAYSMTDSPMLLGTVSALQFMPLLLLSPVSGVLIDRFSKRTLLLVSQAGFVGTSLFMAGAVFSGRVSFGVVALVAVLTGLINVINLPLRQAWISSLVAEEMVVNAVALYSAAFNLARILGPAATGFLMEGLGLGCCYALNAGLFLCALLGLAFVRGPHPRRRAPATLGAIREDLRSGVRYVAGHRAVLSLLAALGTAGIFSINYSVLLPVLAVEVLDRGEVGYGMLMSVMGVGTFLGAFTVAAGRKGEPSAFFLRVSPVLLALTWFVVAGTSPIGNLYAGRLSDRFGVRVGCAACAAAALVCMGLIRVLERRGENKTGS